MALTLQHSHEPREDTHVFVVHDAVQVERVTLDGEPAVELWDGARRVCSIRFPDEATRERFVSGKAA